MKAADHIKRLCIAGASLAIATQAWAQNYPPDTLVTATYHRGAGTMEQLAGTIDGRELSMEAVYALNGSPMKMTVNGHLEGKTLSYTVTIKVIAANRTCTATGTAAVESGMIQIALDQMEPDNSLCRQPSNASYRRNLTIQLPTPP